ncbi:MAG: ABC transporter ATP-binding protein [Actinomycetota bacterium]|nr:ABC transporter ATP-binding protein [Actinomycetota bacterium]
MSLSADFKVRLDRMQLDVSFEASSDETVVVLGPNGAGKSTMLRALAGLVPLDDGWITLDGRTLENARTGTRVPAEQRSTGFVFQDYLLFPHLSVLENVAFGLRARGVGRASARSAAAEWLARMGLSQLERATPRTLSGGQAQRVALARALAIRPRVLLLDEPLAALDAGARLAMRHSLIKDLAVFEGVRMIVTHDPLEAIALGNRLIVLEEGRIVQTGRAAELQARPRSSYVASLVGINLLRGRATGRRVVLSSGAEVVAPEAPSGEVFVAIHPRAVALYRDRPRGTPRNVWPGKVGEIYAEAGRVRVQIAGTVPIVAEVTPDSVADLKLGEGGPVWAAVKATEVVVYPA